MARIQPVIQIELDPSQPVPEICAVISAVMAYHAGNESKVLEGVQKAITDQLEKLKGDEADGKPIREFSRKSENQPRIHKDQ